MNDTIRGTIFGAAVGLAVGLLGELAVALTGQLFPTDVGIVGFAVVVAVPLGAVVGGLCGWRGWLPDRWHRAMAAAAPGVLAGAAAVFMQWSAV